VANGTGTGAVLSDGTIQTQLAALIDNGVADNAKEAGYEFLPGKLFPTGEAKEGKPIDWTDKTKIAAGPDQYAIKRGELLMVRTKESVKMPRNMCGFWYPLDRNSRQGLLLVNMSVVPPGYSGFLTCTFVNFGNRNLILRPHQPIARLVFVKLDTNSVKDGVTVNATDYDQKMSDAASNAPSTFLAIAERAAELEGVVAQAKVGLKEESDRLAKEANDTLRKDAKGLIFSALPWAALAILLLTAAQTGANWFATNVLTDKIDTLAKERAAQIEKQINDQLAPLAGKPVFVYSGSPEAKAMSDRLATIEKQLQEIAAAGKKPTPR
jgi:deoxycytidine triphosphate deaminase